MSFGLGIILESLLVRTALLSERHHLVFDMHNIEFVSAQVVGSENTETEHQPQFS